MKKGFKIGAMSLAALLVFGVAGCGKVSDKDGKAWAEANGYVKEETPAALPAALNVDAEIPQTAPAEPISCDSTDPKVMYQKECSGVTKDNLKDYLGREDVVYLDVRDAGSADLVNPNYDKNDPSKGPNKYNVELSNYSAGHIEGFKNVEFFSYIYAQNGAKGNQLFYKIADNNGIPVFAPTYKNSVEILKELFPQDKTLFIMCAGGSRVVTLMYLLDQYGWDMSKVYNIGGWSQYKDAEAYKDLVIKPGAQWTELTGTASGWSKGSETAEGSVAIDVTVKVLYNSDLEEISQVFVTGGTVASSDYLARFQAELDELLNSFAGMTADEVDAKITEGELTDDNDVVADATNSTTIIYKAVKAALATA